MVHLVGFSKKIQKNRSLTVIGFASAFIVFLLAQGAKPCQAADFDETDRSVVSNLVLMEGVGKKRKSMPRPYSPLTHYKPLSKVSREERFIQLLLSSLGFVGIIIIILALRSVPAKGPAKGPSKGPAIGPANMPTKSNKSS